MSSPTILSTLTGSVSLVQPKRRESRPKCVSTVIPGITVDTHFGRLSRRFGWTKETDPVKVERIVGELIPQKEWTNLSQRMIWHGRRICHSRKPACGACPVAKMCPSVGIGEMDKEKAKLLVKTDKDFR